MSSTCLFMKTTIQSLLSTLQPAITSPVFFLHVLITPNLKTRHMANKVTPSVIHPDRYLAPRKTWLSSRFGNFYEVIATDVFTKLLLKMRLLAKSLSWSQVLCGISVDSMWSLDCRNREWGYTKCLIFLCFFLARKFRSVQEVMSSFVQSLLSPLASACARKNSFS